MLYSARLCCVEFNYYFKLSKLSKMQPMSFFIPAGRKFEETFEDTRCVDTVEENETN